MFQGAYQSGNQFEIFDSKAYKEKDKTMTNLMKATPAHMCKKIFDSEIKGYVYELEGHTTKMRFPKMDKSELGLVQQFLVLQIYIPNSMPWNLEIILTDTSKTKRRINLVPGLPQVEKKFFHVKCPNEMIKTGEWINLCIDVHSFMECWKGQTFRSIDTIIVGSFCKVRKILTTKYPLVQFLEEDDPDFDIKYPGNIYNQQQDLPKNLNLPSTVSYTNQMITYNSILHYLGYPLEGSMSNLQTDIGEQSVSQLSNFNFQSSQNSKFQSSVNKLNTKFNNRDKSQPARSSIQTQKVQLKNKNRDRSVQRPKINQDSDNKYSRESKSPYNMDKNSQFDSSHQSNKFSTQISYQNNTRNQVKNTIKSPLGQNRNKNITPNKIKSPYTTEKTHSNPWASRGPYQKKQTGRLNQLQTRENKIKQMQKVVGLDDGDEDEEIYEEEQKEMIFNEMKQKQKDIQKQNIQQQVKNQQPKFQSNTKAKQDSQKKSLQQKPKLNDQYNKSQNQNQADLIQKREVKTATENTQKPKFKPKTVVKQNDSKKKAVKKEKNLDDSDNSDKGNKNKQNAKNSLLQTGDMRKTDNDYFELSQKFSTINDPRMFQLEANKQHRNQEGYNEQEEIEDESEQIEENIEMENKQSLHSSPNKNEKQNNQNNNNSNSNTYNQFQNSNRFGSQKNSFLNQKNDYQNESSQENAKSLLVTNEKEGNQVQFSQKYQQQQQMQKKLQEESQQNQNSPPFKMNKNQSQFNYNVLADSLEVSKEEAKQIQQQIQQQKQYQQQFQKTTKIEEMLYNQENSFSSKNNQNSQQNLTDISTTNEKKSEIYEERLNKLINQTQRPFTPPFSYVVNLQSNSTLITKKNGQTVVVQEDQSSNNNNHNNKNQQQILKLDDNNSQITNRSQKNILNLEQNAISIQQDNQKNSQQKEESKQNGEEPLLEVIYDPVLNCYYDPKTHSYYELKV